MYTSPNYAKGGKGGASPSVVVDIVLSKLRVPVYEPIMKDEELLLTVSGDLLIAKMGEAPLIVLP